MKGTIVLLTDFTWHNWYVGVMKGVIAGINPEAVVIDLCHNISSQDVREGSFILGNSFAYFPRGSVFVAVVDPGVGSDRRNLVVRTADHLFVAPDNGIVSSIFEKAAVEKVWSVSPGRYTLPVSGSTFFGRDVLAPIGAHLSLGVPPEEMGDEIESVCTVPAIRASLDARGELVGCAVYVDSFGNIITNIDEECLKRTFPGGLPREDLIVRLPGRTIRGVRRYYEQGERGAFLALINSWGHLEIAVNRGNAFRELGLVEKKSLEIRVSIGSKP
jgi:S-adenosylmethionine hydrolase